MQKTAPAGWQEAVLFIVKGDAGTESGMTMRGARSPRLH